MSVVLIGVAVVIVLAAVFYVKKSGNTGHLNKNVEKHKPKVVNTVDIEDLSDATAFCRCWKSSKFPYCDGSHNDHNKCTGDNVGPLLLKRRTQDS